MPSDDAPSLLTLIREDLGAHNGAWSTPGFQAMAAYRFGVWSMGLTGVSRKICGALYFAVYTFIRNFYGIEIPRTAVIGRRLHIGHQHGVSIHGLTVIGDDCVIRNNTTFGVGALSKRDAAPRIGNRVSMSPGVVLMGGITVGDDVVIGPNAIISTDVPDGAIVFSGPTRILKIPRTPIEDAARDTPVKVATEPSAP